MADTGPNIGQLAPEIDLLDGNGERWMLSGARGKVVAPFFYPGDASPVCTKPMCSVRDNWARYQQAGAEVVGVNTDSVEKHRNFAANHKLPIRLLSDSDSCFAVQAANLKERCREEDGLRWRLRKLSGPGSRSAMRAA